MANEFRIKVHGLTELSKGLRSFVKRRAGAIFKASIQAGGTEWAKIARGFAPSQSGALRKGIKSFRMGTGSYFTAKSTITSTVYYGVMQEKGWNAVRTGRYIPGAKRRLRRSTWSSRKKIKGSRRNVIERIAPKPFMRPAFDTGTPRVIAKIGTHLGKAIVKEMVKIGR